MIDSNSQVYACCRSLVRYIHSHALHEGDKLPSQEALRSLLGFSHNTITPAMNLLTDTGMLERKRRLGTVLCDPSAEPEGLWRIALAFGPRDNHPGNLYSSVLYRIVFETLQQRGCSLSHYLRSPQASAFQNELAHFGRLGDDVGAGLIDGVLSPAWFSSEADALMRRHKTRLCQLGGGCEVALRVELDAASVVGQAIEHLVHQGCRRIGLVAGEQHIQSSAEILNRFVNDNQKLGSIAQFHLFSGHDFTATSTALMTKLKQMPASDRPDGLVVLNDMYALLLSGLLLREGMDIQLAVQANRQLPLYYPTPVQLLEFDIEQLVSVGTENLLAHLRHPDLEDQVEKLVATPIPSTHACLGER
jgi:hypothetical protein